MIYYDSSDPGATKAEKVEFPDEVYLVWQEKWKDFEVLYTQPRSKKYNGKQIACYRKKKEGELVVVTQSWIEKA
jgi:hypothetical protein